jgi:hypothetical protein
MLLFAIDIPTQPIGLAAIGYDQNMSTEMWCSNGVETVFLCSIRVLTIVYLVVDEVCFWPIPILRY